MLDNAPFCNLQISTVLLVQRNFLLAYDMCGIWAIFGCEAGSDIKHYASAFKISHRGPDCFQIQNASQLRNCTMAFHRLCVVDSVRGMQVRFEK